MRKINNSTLSFFKDKMKILNSQCTLLLLTPSSGESKDMLNGYLSMIKGQIQTFSHLFYRKPLQNEDLTVKKRLNLYIIINGYIHSYTRVYVPSLLWRPEFRKQNHIFKVFHNSGEINPSAICFHSSDTDFQSTSAEDNSP